MRPFRGARSSKQSGAVPGMISVIHGGVMPSRCTRQLEMRPGSALSVAARSPRGTAGDSCGGLQLAPVQQGRNRGREPALFIDKQARIRLPYPSCNASHS